MIGIDPEPKLRNNRVLLVNDAVAIASVLRLVILGKCQESVLIIFSRLAAE